ncbi:MAG: porin family protein [Hyphomicrobiaceae bacterium]|nr:porin family protein [Hyphomicrobiaceae bacterium]
MKLGRTFAAALLSGVVMAGNAIAADRSGDARSGGLEGGPAASAAPFSWSGFYLGGHIGGTWSPVAYQYTSAAYVFDNTYAYDRAVWVDPSSLSGGLQLGLQRQFGRFVTGVEIGYSFQEGSETVLVRSNLTSLKTEMGDLLTVAGRFGIANDKLLSYVKAGYASADIAVDGLELRNSIVLRNRAHDLAHGYLLGAGIEYAIMDNVTVGLDYTYVNLDAGDATFDIPSSFRTTASYHGIDVDMHQVTFRVNLLLHHDR